MHAGTSRRHGPRARKVSQLARCCFCCKKKTRPITGRACGCDEDGVVVVVCSLAESEGSGAGHGSYKYKYLHVYLSGTLALIRDAAHKGLHMHHVVGG